MHIWNGNKDECISIGREFLRVFLDVAKTPEFKPICEELAREIDGKCLSMHIFENQGLRQNGLNIYIQHMVPTEAKKKIEFLFNQVPHSSYTHYLKWFLDSLGVEFGTQSESQIVDIIRFVIVNVHPPNEIIFETDVLKRYVMIGNLI